MKADRFKKATHVAEQIENLEEAKGRGLRRRAQLHFQDTFFLGVMTWVARESKAKGEKLDGLALDLKEKWNALTPERMTAGYSANQRYW
jgi:hypothetical protein